MSKKQGNEQEFDQEIGDSLDINTDDSVAGSQHLNEPVEDESAIEKLQEEVADLNDRYLRQAAEFENFKRRNARERVELIQTAGREVITSMLDVLDDSERAEKQLTSSDDVEQIREGVSLVFNKLKNTLLSKGLKAMETVGEDFNPDMHEAITEINAGPDMHGKVVDEIQKGYYLNDKIIRFAKVVVGK